MHDELLKKNNGDNKLVKNIEKSIFNVYLKTLSYICDDSYVNVGYRVSKEFKQDIGNIFFETLEKYDMDFASYVRSIIYEYCSRADLQRELFINYDLVRRIKKAIKKIEEKPDAAIVAVNVEELCIVIFENAVLIVESLILPDIISSKFVLFTTF